MFPVTDLRKILLVFTILFLSAGFNACQYDNEEDLYKDIQVSLCDTSNVTYSGTINPIMQANCNSCHNQVSPSGNIATDSYSGLQAITVDGLNGKLWGAINHLNGFSYMPQGGNMLSECDLKKIEIWIKNGTPNN